MTRKSYFLVGIFALALVFAGVSLFNSNNVSAAATKQVIRIGNGVEPKDLDCHKVTGVPEDVLLRQLFEPLVARAAKDLHPIPGVAEKWTISKDGKEYTFKLRANAKWSNGEPVVAQDFVDGWRRLLDPKTASEYAYYGYYLKNGEAINTGKIKDPSQLGAKAINATTLQVTLEHPTPYFLALLDHYTYYPIYLKTIQKNGDRWTRPENFVGNGAYKLQTWEINKVITMIKSPTYWDAANVKIDEASFYPIDNLDTEEKMFRTKQLDVTREIPPEKLPSWQKDKSGVFISADYLGVYYFRLNVTKGVLKDKRVRRALNLAIDRSRIVKFVARGNQEPAQAYTPPGTGGYQPAKVLPSDGSGFAEAKKLLAEAGYPGGKNFPLIEILYNTQEIHKKLAEAVQAMWKENLGINVGIVNQEWKVYLNSMKTLNYDVARSGWIGDFNDPDTFLVNFTSTNGNNQTGYANPVYDKFVFDSQKEQDQKKRFALFAKAEAQLLEDLPVVPIYIWRRNYLKAKNVQGWEPNIQDLHSLKDVWIDASIK